MRNPYRQSDSLDASLRAHGCMLFSTLYLRRWASGGDVDPKGQADIDAAVRRLREAAGMTTAQFLARGTTMTEAEKAFESIPLPGRLPPQMRLMRGGSVRDDLLPELRKGNLSLVAVNYGVIQDAGKGVGTFRGGHGVVVGEPENGQVAVADPLRLSVIRWSVDLLERAMETFGTNPWGDGRGEAGVGRISPTYEQAYTDAQEALARRTAALAVAVGERDTQSALATTLRRERDTARAQLAECEARPIPDCTAVELDLAVARESITRLTRRVDAVRRAVDPAIEP